MTPVPGFCESLLQLTCAETAENAVGPFAGNAPKPKEYCVVADISTPWPKNVRKKSEASSSVWPQALFEGSETEPILWKCTGSPFLYDKFDEGTYMASAWHTRAIARVCMRMYNSGQLPQEVVTDDDTNEKGMLAPFDCRKDSGIGKYFENYTFAVTRDKLQERGEWLDLLHDTAPGASELGQTLARCHIVGTR